MKKIIGQLKPYVPEEPAESVKARLGVDAPCNDCQPMKTLMVHRQRCATQY